MSPSNNVGPPSRTARILAAEGVTLQGDGEITCLQCGQQLDSDSAEELREGLCVDHVRLTP